MAVRKGSASGAEGQGSWVQGKTVLVTGGSGTIGSHVVEELLAQGPKAVRVLGNDEHGIFQMQSRLGGRKDVRFLLGDVRDAARMERAMHGADAVFHAAALKHVPLCEYNPFEAMKTNVLGTQVCIEAALASRVGRFVFVSTDKAVNPVSTMGASKFMAERLVLAAGRYQGDAPTRFCAVRFGNVLDSRGSVVQTFREQVQSGQRPTLTDVGMTRFVMPIPAAARLILRAAGQAEGGEIFILKMPAVRIGDLLRAVAQDVLGRPASLASLKPVTIGLREGEKMHEELMTGDEAARAAETKDMFVVGGKGRKARARTYSSRSGPFLGVQGIRNLLAQSAAGPH